MKRTGDKELTQRCGEQRLAHAQPNQATIANTVRGNGSKKKRDVHGRVVTILEGSAGRLDEKLQSSSPTQRPHSAPTPESPEQHSSLPEQLRKRRRHLRKQYCPILMTFSLPPHNNVVSWTSWTRRTKSQVRSEMKRCRQLATYLRNTQYLICTSKGCVLTSAAEQRKYLKMLDRNQKVSRTMSNQICAWLRQHHAVPTLNTE